MSIVVSLRATSSSFMNCIVSLAMGMLFVLVTLKLGGWWMCAALGGRFLQVRFSPMPL